MSVCPVKRSPTKFPPYLESILLYIGSLIPFLPVSFLKVRQIKNLNVSIFPRLVDINLACPLDFENERYLYRCCTYQWYFSHLVSPLFLVIGILCVCILLSKFSLIWVYLMSGYLESLYEIKQKVRHFQSKFLD